MKDDTSRECVYCGQPIISVDGVWVVMGSGTTADGLTYCPPDPDREPVGDHVPVEAPAPSSWWINIIAVG